MFEPEGEKEHEAEYKKIHEDYKNLVDIPPTHQLDKSRTLMYLDTSIYSCSLVTWIWKNCYLGAVVFLLELQEIVFWKKSNCFYDFISAT